MRFVLFVGPKQSGKDTAAEILRKKGKSRQKISFAGPLKEICSNVLNLEPKYFNDPTLKEKELETPIVLDRRTIRLIKRELPKYLPELGKDDLLKYNIDRVSIAGLENRTFKTPREALQQIGTDFIRDRVYDQWHVEAAFSEASLEKYENGKLYCITDTRFLNEYEYLMDNFGDDLQVYYIERPEAEAQLEKATHASELEILKIKELLPEESIIKNDGSLEDFEKKVLALDLPTAKKGKSKRGKGLKPKSKFVYGSRNG